MEDDNLRMIAHTAENIGRSYKAELRCAMQ